MSVKAILFDLDGTLLPMDQEKFTYGYFKELSKVICPLGIAPEKLVEAVWAGTSAMVKNTGERKNLELFWDTYCSLTQMDRALVEPMCDAFYVNEFNNTKVLTGENPLAKEAVTLAHEKAEMVILASNPLFPKVGHLTRMSWVGLAEEDFDYITSYETENHCKPNPDYYRMICEKNHLEPSECLMIGNDELEDMYAASSIGMECFLVTDSLIANEAHPWEGRRGSFAQLIEYLKML